MTKYHFLQCSKGNNSIKVKVQLWFLCSACRLIVVNISAKFGDNISNGFQVTGRTRFYDQNHVFSVQRAITPKVGSCILYAVSWW